MAWSDGNLGKHLIPNRLDPHSSKQACSFLKKRTKKFGQTGRAQSGKAAAQTTRSFLLLFFKKEDLCSFHRSVTLKSVGITVQTFPPDTKK
jgi:hypothetical protein